MAKMLPELTSSPVVTRYQGGAPVLSKQDIPYEADCIFNCGVIKYQGQYVCAFRNDYGFDGVGTFTHCVIGLAFSEDGIHWKAREKPFITVDDIGDPDVTKVYDPRLTVIDGVVHLCFAVDTNHGLRGGIAITRDFETIEVQSLSVPDNRNDGRDGADGGALSGEAGRQFPHLPLPQPRDQGSHGTWSIFSTPRLW